MFQKKKKKEGSTIKKFLTWPQTKGKITKQANRPKIEKFNLKEKKNET